MTKPVTTFFYREKVAYIIKNLMDKNFDGFPILNNQS